jgi:hypothetical protein
MADEFEMTEPNGATFPTPSQTALVTEDAAAAATTQCQRSEHRLDRPHPRGLPAEMRKPGQVR